MNDETTEEHEERQEESKGKRIQNMVTLLDENAEERTISNIEGIVDKLLGRKTPERVVVEEVIDEQAQRVPARSAARTVPSHLSDSRYRGLGEAHTYRNASDDVACQRWLLAVRDNDAVALREINAEDRHARAALAIGDPGANFGVSDGTGAQLLPLPLANYLQAAIYRTARMRQHARVFDASTGNSLRIPIQDAKSGNSWDAEGAGGPGSQEGTIADGVKLDLQKLRNITDVTDELLESSAFNVGSWLAMDVGDGMAEEEDLKEYQDGAGSAADEPAGLEASDTTTAALPAYYVAVAGDQTGANDFTDVATLTAAHLAAMFFALPERLRGRAIWTAADSVAQLLSTLVDGNGRPILNFANNPLGIVSDSFAEGTVGTIFGRPFINMPGLAGVGEDSNRLYFSDMSRTYAILERGAIRAEASRDFKFSSDVTTFKFVRRVDGQPIGNRTSGLPFDYVYSGNLN